MMILFGVAGACAGGSLFFGWLAVGWALSRDCGGEA